MLNNVFKISSVYIIVEYIVCIIYCLIYDLMIIMYISHLCIND